MIDVHRHRRKNSHQMKRLFLVNRRQRRSNPAIGWTYGGWWVISSSSFGYYYRFGGHRSRRVGCYHGVTEAVLGSKCHSSFVAAFKCVLFLRWEYFLYEQVHTLLLPDTKLTLSTGFPTFCIYEFDVNLGTRTDDGQTASWHHLM